MRIDPTHTVGSVVAEDYRAAAVFSAHRIDFCCQGGRSIGEACKAKGVDPALLERQIQQALQRDASTGEFNTWTLTRLVDHIEAVHHAYVHERLEVLQRFLDKLCRVHGGRHPELQLVQAEMKAGAGELTAHMRKEELMLFPFIKRMEHAVLDCEALPKPLFGSVGNPISMMEVEHRAEGDRLRRIAELTNDFANPPDGCATYAAAMALLKEFEEDLHLHIHLENNILFPKALAMEHMARSAGGRSPSAPA